MMVGRLAGTEALTTASSGRTAWAGRHQYSSDGCLRDGGARCRGGSLKPNILQSAQLRFVLVYVQDALFSTCIRSKLGTSKWKRGNMKGKRRWKIYAIISREKFHGCRWRSNLQIFCDCVDFYVFTVCCKMMQHSMKIYVFPIKLWMKDANQ